MTDEQEKIEQIKANQELFERMSYTGLDVQYSEDRSCCLSYNINGYKIQTLKSGVSSDKVFYDTNELKSEFLKLRLENPNIDWECNFKSFMAQVADIKEYYDIK